MRAGRGHAAAARPGSRQVDCGGRPRTRSWARAWRTASSRWRPRPPRRSGRTGGRCVVAMPIETPASGQPLQHPLAILDLDVPALARPRARRSRWISPSKRSTIALRRRLRRSRAARRPRSRRRRRGRRTRRDPANSTTASWMIRAVAWIRRSPADEPLLVVVGLEVVEVRVQHGERPILADHPLDLLLDPDVAGQPGERREVAHLLGPPQRPLDAREELDRVERLDDVVVGARGEPEHLVGRQRLGGQHDDRRVRRLRVPAKALRDLEPVDPRHHHVEQDQVGPQRCRPSRAPPPRRRRPRRRSPRSAGSPRRTARCPDRRRRRGSSRASGRPPRSP